MGVQGLCQRDEESCGVHDEPGCGRPAAGAVSAAADLLLSEQQLALRTPSLHDLLLSQVRQHVRLHLLSGVCERASLRAHNAASEIQRVPEEMGHAHMWFGLAAGLSGLSALSFAQDH